MKVVKSSTIDTEISLEEAMDGVDEIVISEPLKKGGRLAAIDEAVKAKARELYMNHTPYEAICQSLELKKTTLTSWVSREGWNQDRKQNEDSLIQEDLATKKYLLSQLSLEVLQNCLKGVRKAGGADGFKPKDLVTFLSALGNVEKLSRLSLGLATSISEERSKRANFTLPIEHLKGLQQVKVSDPFSLEAPKEGQVSEPSAPNSERTDSDT